MIFIYDANAYLRQSLHRQNLGGVVMDPRVIYERANVNPHPEFWVWDGPRHNDRRRAIFPGYKIRDYTGQENIFAGLDLYRQVLSHSNAIQVEVPDWEADDVCATLARRFTSQGELVTIFTNDFDYHQLSDLPGLTIKEARGPKDVVEPRYLSLYKALVGDPSDKIPGIAGFGPKTWLSFQGIYDVLDRAMWDKDAITLRAQPFKPKVKSWLMDDDNIEMCFAWYGITQMYDVPIQEIEAHMKPGVPDPVAAQSILGRFML